MTTSERLTQLIVGFCGIALLILFAQSILPDRVPPVKPREEVAEEECVGEPIYIDYAYTGTVVEPHSCKIQCEDKKQHYIVYTNGKATPCDPLPGCFDYGEDHGVTCKIPGGVSGSGTSVKS